MQPPQKTSREGCDELCVQLHALHSPLAVVLGDPRTNSILDTLALVREAFGPDAKTIPAGPALSWLGWCCLWHTLLCGHISEISGCCLRWCLACWHSSCCCCRAQRSICYGVPKGKFKSVQVCWSLEVVSQASSFHGARWSQCPADTRRLAAQIETSTIRLELLLPGFASAAAWRDSVPLMPCLGALCAESSF